MIYGAGVDIVEIPRMRSAISKHGDIFVNKLFTPREIAYARARKSSAQHFAGRFAAKEAFAKAFGEPKKFPIKWTEVEIVNDKEGKPVMKFYGAALKFFKKKHIAESIVSISHSRNYAIANVILLKKAAA